MNEWEGWFGWRGCFVGWVWGMRLGFWDLGLSEFWMKVFGFDL